MAYIKTLKDNELIGGTDNTDVYPVSTTQAIFSQKPDGTVPGGIKHQRLEERLEDNEDDARELHRKSEKLVVYLNNNQANKTLEITGNANVMTLTGSAQIETFGDEPSQTITQDEMTVKRMTVTTSGTELYNEPVTTTTFNFSEVIGSEVVGTYTSKFECEYNGVSKYATTNTRLDLRKYFGFAESAPSDVTTLGVSHGPSNANYSINYGVACTVTIPANGTGFKYIYLSVPNGMTINRVVQPDALNAPLAITQVGTITRTIGGSSYIYKLYRGDDLIDSSVSKRLTIS